MQRQIWLLQKQQSQNVIYILYSRNTCFQQRYTGYTWNKTMSLNRRAAYTQHMNITNVF